MSLGPFVPPLSNLATAIRQQLQQSGFLAALPGLLDAAVAALTATQQEPAMALALQHGSSSRPIIVDDDELCAAVHRVQRTQSVVARLLRAMGSILDTLANQVDMGAVTVPALRACTAALQHCSRCVDLSSPGAAAPIALNGLLLTAGTTVKAVCLACLQQGQGLNLASFVNSAGYPGAVSAICMVLMVQTLPTAHLP
jgi:hypothetical protein